MIVGDLIVHTIDGVHCRITRADPYILIADDFVREMRFGLHEPLVCVDGDVFTFSDSYGARWVYRLTGARDAYGSWYAEWPD